MLEKVIEKVRALNEPNPCRLEAKYKPHTHTSDEVFMGDIGEWEGESLTYTLGAIVVMIEGKADVNHEHDEISDGDEARVYFEDGDVRISGKDFVIGLSDSEGEDIIRITESDLINLARAKRNPDSTPTEDSDNLVMSGGVAAALAGKADTSALAGKANVNHSQAISTITGLQTALDNKVPAALGRVSMSERINITGLKDGLTYLLDSTTAKSLSDVLISPYTIRYSRNDVGANKKFLIRVYTSSLASFSYVEIVDAWS